MNLGFFKTSRADIIAHKTNLDSAFSKSAAYTKTASFFQNEGIGIDVQAVLDDVADTYKISKNSSDYLFVISRALTADVPNENNDAFPKEELLRFDPQHGSRVFQTFINKPNHINHRADDPTQARGVIIDAHFNDINPKDEFVEILVAVDKTKDKRLAEGIQKNDITSMSMGCFAEECECSICGHIAATTADLCPDHIRGGRKGKSFEGKLAFEKCHQVCFQEESWVDDPADPSALVSEVMDISAKIASAKEKHNMEDESTLLALGSRLAKLEEKLAQFELNAGEDSDLINSVDMAKLWLDSGRPEARNKASEIMKQFLSQYYPEVLSGDKLVTLLEMIEKAQGVSVPDLVAQIRMSIRSISHPILDVESNNTETNIKESQMSENLYKKLADHKKAKGGGNPGDWKGIDSGKGSSPKEWTAPGKQNTAGTPSEWKFATISKLALDDKAKEYWTKYYKDGYGADLIKDIKRKKISSKEILSVDQMKVLEPQFAELMTANKIDNIKVATIEKMSELFDDSSIMGSPVSEGSGETSSAKWSDTDGAKGVSEGSGDVSNQKWHSIDASLDSGSLTLDLLTDGWHVKDADSSLMVIENIDSLPVEEFEGDEFGQAVIGYLLENGAEKTAGEYKVALYPAIGNEPSLVNEDSDDIRDKNLRPKPSQGAEEGGEDDIADGYRGDIEETGGVTESVTLDMPTKASSKKAAEEGAVEDEVVASEEEVVAAEEIIKEEVVASEESPEELEAKKKAPKKKDEEEDEKEAKKSPKKKDEEEDEKEAKKSPKKKDEKEAKKSPKKKDEEEDEKEAKKSPKKKDEEEDEKDKKDAGVLDDADADIDVSLRDEPSKGILTSKDGDVSDMAGIERATTVGDEIYAEGQDDLEPKRDNIVTVGAKEYPARFKRALNVAIQRANLNMINNELKATMHDVLTSEAELSDGDEYEGMDDSLAAELVEMSFEVGASKFFGTMLKEAEKYASMSEDAFLEIEADLADLNMLPPAVEKEATEFDMESDLEAMSKAEEAIAGNPVFKSTASIEAPVKSGKFPGLKGMFGTVTASRALDKLKSNKSFLG